MVAGQYSYIDITALDTVRLLFAAGEPLVLLTAELDEVIWANGPGAALFGYADVASIIGRRPNIGAAASRQIRALPGFPRTGPARTVTVRLASGLASRAVPLSVRGIELPDGERAVLLATPGPPAQSIGTAAAAGRAIAGLDQAGQHAAIVGADGAVLAASAGFQRLGIAQDVLMALARQAERDRLIKRMIDADGGALPAGFVRLSDEPATHLLVVIEEKPALPAAAGPRGPEEEAVAADPAGSGDAVPRQESSPSATPATAEPSAAPQAALPATPLRFVWKTDPDGRFSEVSEEFLRLVGFDAGEIVGHAFRDVAARLGFDGDGEIAGLLERRDTWSGRSVQWPVAGTALRIPVDLAALPAYGRDRTFMGFRGFGVARPHDAKADEPAAREASGETRDDDAPARSAGVVAADEDPFRGEVPALSIEQGPERRESDKVIRLAERRPFNGERALSAGERNAFREIGDRLRKDGAVGDETGSPGRSDTPAAVEPSLASEPATALEPEEPLAERQAEAPLPAEEVRLAGSVGLVDDREPSAPAADAAPPEEESVAAADVPAEPEPGFDTAILDGLPLPLLIHSGDMLHYANRAFLDMTGYSLDELRSAGGLDALFGEPYEQAAAGADGRRLRLRTSDGAEHPVEASLQSVPWRGGKALLLTLRPHEEEAEPAQAPRTDLEDEVAQLRAIIDTATDGVVLIAADGTIRSISRPAEALFGYDSAEVVGKPFTSLFAIESQRAARDYLAGLSENGVASVLNDGREVIGRESQGRFIPLFMTIGRLPKEGGFCAVLRDITPWKRAEEELTQARAEAERSSSQKTEFLARVSHEIRTPLNAIIGFSELMIDEKFGPILNDRYRDYLRDINRSGNHVLDLVNDLLDISKIEAGQQEMNYEAVSLNDTLTQTVAMMQPQANRERVIIRSSLASRLPDVVADQRSIRQIALNLMSNAIRYTPAGGQVIVSTAYEASGDVVMRVRDTGVGMSQAEIEQALKPFKQINALKRARGDGTGLGLPLTKAMVEANRARFMINSTPGEGTLVEITFPSTRVLAE